MATDRNDVEFAKTAAMRIVARCASELEELVLDGGVAFDSEQAADREAVIVGVISRWAGLLIGRRTPCMSNLQQAMNAACHVLTENAAREFNLRVARAVSTREAAGRR